MAEVLAFGAVAGLAAVIGVLAAEWWLSRGNRR